MLYSYQGTSTQINPSRSHAGSRLKAVALDCEMVGGGDDGTIDQCASVCLVDEDENVILSTHVRPQLPVTDYRFCLWTFVLVLFNNSSF